MILADTSVWVDHLRSGDAGLARLLNRNLVAIHPFVSGELACGNLSDRRQILDLLQRLPAAPEASHHEVLLFVEQHGLMGRGIGWVDVHLLAAARLGSSMTLWTRDKRLHAIAAELGLGWKPN